MDSSAAAVEADKIRLITVMGHVDHGKTTFVDSLLAANNIISSRMAGKIRYMDSREDEQERGITMESSAVSLRFTMVPEGKKGSDNAPQKSTYVLNLIDTPGHVDFSSEVSAASRLCDGALVMLDVVEGVCTQTVTVLHQAWLDRIRPIVVFNKLDRLATELQLTPMEAYGHLTRLLEQVNAVIGSLFAGERMEEDYKWKEVLERRSLEKERKIEASFIDSLHDDNFQTDDDDNLYFSPDRGNVIFSSAVDGWAFRIGNFSRIFAERFEMNEKLLRSALWGDFYIDPKTKRVIGRKHLRGRNLKPLFVQIILENLWAVYDAVLKNGDSKRTEKIVKSLRLAVPAKELQSKDPRQVLFSIFSRWLPLATTTVQAVIEVIPSPIEAQKDRMSRLLRLLDIEASSARAKVVQDVCSCNPSTDADAVAYVSKMFAVPPSILSLQLRLQLRGNDAPTPDGDANISDTLSTSEVFLGFTRLYSGILRVGDSVHVVLPKFDNTCLPFDSKNHQSVLPSRISGLFLMMGRELVATSEVCAGNVFAIAGIGGQVLRNATVCSAGSSSIPRPLYAPSDHPDHIWLLNLAGSGQAVLPFVRVAVEPMLPADLPKLVEGLRLLCQADPCVETYQQHSGEHVLVAAGELHIERCLKDLQDRFAQVQIQASKPMVPFRETIISSPGKPTASVTIRHSELDSIHFVIRIECLPDDLRTFLSARIPSLDLPDMASHEWTAKERGTTGRLSHISSFHDDLRGQMRKAGGQWVDAKVWALGPGGMGTNVLVDARTERITYVAKEKSGLEPTEETKFSDESLQGLEDAFEAGFQAAGFQGPLCGEPLEGTAIFVDRISVDLERLEGIDGQLRRSQLSGSCISGMKDACHDGLLEMPLRLMLAMYACEIQSSSEVLGKVYAVIARRQGRVVAEEVQESTGLFTIKALIPVVESFGFALEIRKRTSGAAHPQLIFQGYELLDIDPFWVPTTAEELEDLGEKADKENLAKAYVDAVRERKGMFVDRKILSSAEKQRTRKR